MGVGIGPAGDGTGVRHTSTAAISMPPREQFANITYISNNEFITIKRYVLMMV
jgi:hypothetical protein